MTVLVARFLGDETGATSIEYGLIAAVIALVVIGSLSVVGTKMKAKFNQIAGNLT